jgi:hypothetical protein
MHTKTCASAVKIYLFFLFISLLAVSGCGLDIDFGGTGNNGNADVADEEIIRGTIKEVSGYEGASFVIKACVVEDGSCEVRALEEDVFEDDKFSLEGNFDPEVKLEIFETGDESEDIATRTIEVFPGATIDIGNVDINNKEEIVSLEAVEVTFNGEVDVEGNKDCTEEDDELNGRILIKISAEGSETVVVTVRLDDTGIEGENNPRCDQLAPGREVEIRNGEPTGEPKTVEAKDPIRLL